MTESFVRSSWALSLFGARTIGVLANPAAWKSIPPTLDALTEEATDHLGRRLAAFFSVTDGVQRGVIDLTFSAARLDPGGLVKPSLDVVQPLAEGLRIVAPEQGILVDWQELRNKIDIYDLVRNVDDRLGLPEKGETPELSEIVDRAYALGSFRALWAVEGAGHYYADRHLRTSDAPREILGGAAARYVSPASLSMLHAGIGLAFAGRLLDDFDSGTSSTGLRQLVERFVSLCRANSIEGYTGCALESLGLVARTFNRELFLPIDRELREMRDDELLGYYWHGAGRSVYFSPRTFLPRIGIRLATLADEAPHETGKRNLFAGLAWAITLVNMRKPEILEKLLERQACQLPDRAAFANGVSSAILMRHDTTPGVDFLRSFCSYQPRESSIARLWHELVVEPCGQAIDQYYPAIQSNRQIGEVFRFQNLQALAARLHSRRSEEPT